MNKYIIPICDIKNGKVYIKTIVAKSYADCQEKLMADLTMTYDIEDCVNYREFVQVADSEYDVLIGDIKDVEEI